MLELSFFARIGGSGISFLWAMENGITAGTGAGTFSPETDCTRGQVVTFLYRAMANK